jgi:predicted nuclease of predicted toxin-antitoxin system
MDRATGRSLPGGPWIRRSGGIRGAYSRAAVKLLLDVHIAKATAGALRRRLPSVQVEHLAQWRDGGFLRAGDPDILTACAEEGRVFVTFDQRTIPDFLRQWAAQGRDHVGVIFGDKNSVPPDHPGTVAAALALLGNEIGDAPTLNMVRYMRRARD